ncbi:FAD-binding oxidoreductase [Thalassospira sp.]|uniref:NAD(P)/FAD-dependent oxidoreductase n=1 Tax=Thalassospira sp. TaxID=1912094 RepID=UPI002734A342|nr:FAD-binding oxidoreductase [Thalassospira sp.]MDP2699839.1 FAD-binding oxidoreductase [Thalassospira sp.]
MFRSYWQDTAPAFDGSATGDPEQSPYDVVVIGGGFTGLSAARHLAAQGVKTVVLESSRIGRGASGRNGGHLNNGLAHSFTAAVRHLGKERAAMLYHAFDRSIDMIETIISQEKIDCDFRRAGKLKMAEKPAHFDALRHNFDALRQDVDPDIELLSAQDMKNDIGSDAFHGGLLWKKSAMMHMGKYAVGLAMAATRHGAAIFEHCPVTQRHTKNGLHHLTTPRGTFVARHVLLATGAYTTGPFGYFRRRIIPVGSYIVATRPLDTNEVAKYLPGNRTYVTSKNIGNYFRLSPDNRLIFGGRARFSAASNPHEDEKSSHILRARIAEIFPGLADIGIDYCWGGLVDMTRDRFPRAGFANNVWFAMGYSGHGAQISTLMGMAMADAIMGRPDHNPVAGLKWSAIPGYFGKPWFLPIIGAYYRYRDLVS